MSGNSLQLLPPFRLFSHTSRSMPTYSHVADSPAMWSWSIPIVAVMDSWGIPSTTPGRTVSAHLCQWNYVLRSRICARSQWSVENQWSCVQKVRGEPPNWLLGWWVGTSNAPSILGHWGNSHHGCHKSAVWVSRGSNTWTRCSVGICPYECIDCICKHKCRPLPAADLLAIKFWSYLFGFLETKMITSKQCHVLLRKKFNKKQRINYSQYKGKTKTKNKP